MRQMPEATGSSTRADIESLARLLMPAEDERRGQLTLADPRWRFDPGRVPPGTEVVIWGRPPAPAGEPVPATVLAALVRMRRLRALRRRSGPLRVVAVHPLFPAARGRRGFGDRLRQELRAGALVELATHDVPRVFDVVAEAAGVVEQRGGLHIGSGGGVRCRVIRADGSEGILRLAPTASPGDPSRAVEALARLANREARCVPRLAGRGIVHGVSWAVESVLPGRQPRRLSPRLGEDAARFCASLPHAPGPPAAPGDDLERIAAHLPDHSGALHQIGEEIDGALVAAPAVMRHGDFWAGNLLTRRGRLSGVVDWDAAHPAEVPGADLLQLVATNRRFRARRSLGQEWTQSPWGCAEFRARTATYWPVIGWRPNDDATEAIGLAWWAREVAGTLARKSHRSSDTAWLSANVEPVVARFSTRRQGT